MQLNTSDKDKIIDLLKNGLIGIMPTDTVYGIHCLAFRPNLISKIVRIKQRNADKPFITLISDTEDLRLFNINKDNINDILNNYWPGPNTLVLTTKDNKSMAVRLPKNEFLLSILKETGPLISTSANISSHCVVKTINDAINIFSDELDFYVDGGILDSRPSNIYKIDSKSTIVKIR